MDDNSKDNGVIGIEDASVTDNNIPSVTNNSTQENIELGEDIPLGREQERKEIINRISGLEFNINHIIGAADSYVGAKYLLYAFKGNYENEDIYSDSIPLRLLAVAVLFIITLYHMYSNRWAIIINRMFAIFKSIAILFVSIYGFANAKNQLTFNNTPSDEKYELSIIEHIGSHGNALVL
ncbi:15356_t:CDS:2, partial [Cetraspora pellucida]